MATHSSILAWKNPMGKGSWGDCSPCGCKRIRSPGEGHGNPLQYSCLENPMDRGAWWATVHRVSKSRTRLSDFTFTFPFSRYFPSAYQKSVLILLEQNTLLSSAKNCHGKYRNLQIFPLDLSSCAVHNLYGCTRAGFKLEVGICLVLA